jgi:hypothetical protein
MEGRTSRYFRGFFPMTPDAYDLLKQGLFLWQQNALNHNDASEIKKKTFEIPLSIKGPVDVGYWQVTNVYYDKHHGIVFEAQVKPYTSNE